MQRIPPGEFSPPDISLMFQDWFHPPVSLNVHQNILTVYPQRKHINPDIRPDGPPIPSSHGTTANATDKQPRPNYGC
jgi:hypothetical protein